MVSKRAKLAEALKHVIARRLAGPHPGIRCDTYPYGLRHAVVGDGTNFVGLHAYLEPGGIGQFSLSIINGSQTAASHIMMEESNLWLNGCKLGELSRIIDLINTGYYLYHLKVPYGYVGNDGRVTLLLWAYIEDGLVPNALSIGVSQYVLAGHRPPPELRYEVGQGRAYMDRFWSLLAQGRLVPLRERFVSHIGPIWLNSGTDLPFVRFELLDGGHPILPARQDYLLWLPTDFPTRTEPYRLGRVYAAHNAPPLDLRRLFGDEA